MKFKWDEINIRRAVILAGEGYTAPEAAAAMGTTRSSISCRASRKKEFSFTHAKRCFTSTPASREAAIAEAKALIERLAPRPAGPEGRERVSAPKQLMMVPIRESGRPTQPQVGRANALVEKPLTEAEKISFLAEEGITSSSVAFSEMGKDDCRWIVGRDEFGEAMACGRKRKQGSPYCEDHAAKSVSVKQPRPINPKIVQSWDQSIKPVDHTKKTASLLQRKS
jgi:hypothetical protein